MSVSGDRITNRELMNQIKAVQVELVSQGNLINQLFLAMQQQQQQLQEQTGQPQPPPQQLIEPQQYESSQKRKCVTTIRFRVLIAFVAIIIMLAVKVSNHEKEKKIIELETVRNCGRALDVKIMEVSLCKNKYENDTQQPYYDVFNDPWQASANV